MLQHDHRWPPVLAHMHGAMLLRLRERQHRDRVRAQHLAITRDGIKYVVDKHSTGCRLECQDQGKVSKTVPYDKMTDCDVEEPAGSSGCCLALVPNTLHVVNVDTASGNRDSGGHELSISGLLAPVNSSWLGLGLELGLVPG